ncbi:DNA repair protein RecN [Acetivibrio clariflavus]|uniref:DNA repair protein RecN n=1 Tax=Acetivibrio clariflavus (strain DSM 19732 / NBRC 101661 / EBR45) TaxID=720554 RepID=G8LW29_ACECE|nr:DNA repair protein RecN [Acetivibrio clariflavus]AEV68633.1 DNA replication and repair protein RecN [Acetivibrio clariflavus DSM 19732]
MLQRLQIQNIAIIDKVEIELGDGLNVLTGETGAGKSIIIDSIKAILGERLSKDLIRTGKDKAVVEAVFAVDNDRLKDIFEEFGIEPEEDGTLIVSREFTLSGKNVCRINGKMATVSMLKSIGEHLIDIHGQHDNQSLLRTGSHIDLLDSFSDESIHNLKSEYGKKLAEYLEIKNKLKLLSGDQNERERKIDFLQFQIDEIRKAKLKPNEDEELSRQRLILQNAERIISALSKVYELMGIGSKTEKSASDIIGEAVSVMNDISKLDQKYAAVTKRLESLSFEVEDIVAEIRSSRDEIDYDQEMLDQIEERLDLIYKLKKKYGDSIEKIKEYMERAQQELKEILNNEELVNKLKDDLKKVNDELFILARKISAKRREAAELLEKKIGFELDDLEMKNAKLKVIVEFDESTDENGDRRYNHNGLDKVEFLISTNPGEPLKPLAKIASGGEMSRIMLAIKTILANVDKIPTLIFDEIDIGISGKAAQKVGEKMSYISKKHQVISVTHLAQIACMADNNYYIEKSVHKQSTSTTVKKLDENEVKREVARIIGGTNISDITLKHAEEMIEYARKYKNNGMV